LDFQPDSGGIAAVINNKRLHDPRSPLLVGRLEYADMLPEDGDVQSSLF